MSNKQCVGRAARWSLFLFKVFCSAVIFGATLFTLWTVGPYLERWTFGPVVSKLRIITLHENRNGQAVIMAEFTKLRGCEFVGVSWYHKMDEGGFERVPVQLLRREGDKSSPNRPLGLQRAGPWIIGVPAVEISRNSFARLDHRCHGLWLTTTEFYP